MTNQATELGTNRTGIGTSKEAAERMVEGTAEFPPNAAGDERSVSEVRELFAQDAEPLGTLPMPPSLHGMASTAWKAAKGARPTQLIDKLGERLAFERTGVRLYEALISKYKVYGGFEGGPELTELESNMLEEYEHLRLLTQLLTQLGADPTVMTPSADLHATITKGVLEVMVDARTSFVQCLEALLVAELADNECWEALQDMALESGDEAMAASFAEALNEEAAHLEDVRVWLAAAQQRPRAQQRSRAE